MPWDSFTSLLSIFRREALVSSWNSATITGWVSQGVGLSRLVFFAPLLLHYFETVDIAAYYMIATLANLGAIPALRISLTFSRYISFAMAGAREAFPVDISKAQSGGEKDPNWDNLEKIFHTFGLVMLIVGAATVAVCGLIGFTSLHNLYGSGASGSEVNLNYYLFITLALVFSRIVNLIYKGVIYGLNRVAFYNRWDALTNAIGIIASIFALRLGYGLVELLEIQVIAAVACYLRNLIFVKGVLRKQLQSNRLFIFDRSGVLTAWTPTWQGLIGQLSTTGVVQGSGFLLTFYFSAGVVAAYFFSIRILTTIARFSQMPFASKQPVFSMLWAKGDMAGLKKLFRQRLMLTLVVFSILTCAVGAFADTLLRMIGSNIDFMPVVEWGLMTTLYLHDRFNVLVIALAESSNNVIFYWREFCSGCVTIIALILLEDKIGLIGPIAVIFGTRALFLNVAPLAKTALLHGSESYYKSLLRFYLPLVGAHILLCVGIAML